jgi:hypothetical protein
MMPPRPVPALLCLIGVIGLPLRPATAQEPAGREIGVQGLALLQNPVWVGGGVYGAWRPGGKSRLAATLGLGSADGEVAGRGELLVHFLLSPGRLHGVAVYGLGGIAGVVGRRDQGYLVLGLGLEQAPGAGSGWVVEAGVGGGARILAGWRWRRLSPMRRQ